MNAESEASYEFGPFRLVPAERQLLRDSQLVSLPPKAFDTLIILVQNSGHALKKEDLIQQVWPDSFVEESNLNHNISVLRKALNDGQNGDGYVETVRGYGFRFKAEVRAIPDELSAAFVHRRTRTHVVVREETSETQKHTRIERTTTHQRLRPMTLVLGLVVAATVLTAVWAIFLKPKPSSDVSPTSDAPVIRSIAVLPFKPIGAEGSDDYLGLGLADALITKLAKTRRVIVRPTSAIQNYTSNDRDPVAIGRQLKVDAVLDGRMQRTADRVRITTQLLHVQDGTVVWTEEFDGKVSDLFDVQDVISLRVARAVVPNLTEAELARLGKRATENTEAYQAYLKGRYFWNKRTADDSIKSAEYFRRAIELDSNFALAYVGLADAYNYFPLPRNKKAPLVRAALETALNKDNTLAEAQATLANQCFLDDWDWFEAERRFQRAIELNPNYATAHHWYAFYLAARGRLDEALTEIRRAQDLDPLSLIINTDTGQLLHFARRDAEAVEQLQKTIEMDPGFIMAHHRLAEVYARVGRYEEALTEFQKAGRGHQSELVKLALIGQVHGLSGNQSEARRILAFIAQHSKEERSKVSKPTIALIHAGLGDNDQALAWLEKALAEKDVELIFLKVNPLFDNIRPEARFQSVLRRMNLSV